MIVERARKYSLLTKIPEQLKHQDQLVNATNADCVANLRMDRKTHLVVFVEFWPIEGGCRLVAFKTGDYKQQVIFIGGLTDGFLATDLKPCLYEQIYLEPLAIALEKERWSLVQFLFSSSYSGYGISSLKQGGFHACSKITDSEGVVLLGHSTRCQDIVYYLRTNAACSRAVRATILQAPVSDREYRATLPETASMIDLASTMINEGRGSELMPTEANSDSSITAYRFHSLCAYNGDDDMFSTDFSEDQLRQKLGHMSNTPTSILLSWRSSFPREMNMYQNTWTRKLWLTGRVQQWAAQRRLKLSMETTRSPTELRKLSKP
ncbi:UPF0613 protein PB24D3.06c [Salvia divinorum]|uniref:UPF0613 protein PB24D3.06c n=1 Tax=Salvia divinorum TaxID=28513 RepID=A0ABD1FWP2_SALDI